ncbi:MAG: PD40 domain-containing protein [Bacteroidaceae bacterium]|nr:PD40 domain-containing protein [Bacteroidaceae bacterium]
MNLRLLLLLIITALLNACHPRPKHTAEVSDYPHIVPDYVGVTIPTGIAPLHFAMPEAERMEVELSGTRGEKLHSHGTYAKMDLDQWHQLLSANRGDSLTVSVTALVNGEWRRYRPFPIYVSADTLRAWGLTYRLIPPGYESYGQMGLYERELRSFSERPLLENSEISRGCINCHTPLPSEPETFTFHVRGPHGATVVSRKGTIEMLAPRNEALGGSMVYPYWHPTGSYIAYSTNDTHQNFYSTHSRRIEVYDNHSDILIYRPDSHQILLDSLLARPDRLESYPTFSPDGRSLYYCTAQRQDSIWKNYSLIRYDICRIAFHPETGRLGTSVDTLVHASRSGHSACMPRISPDERFLLFALCDYGCFPIWHPEADLWMMDLKTNHTFPLRQANSQDAESFHAWSPDSRWIVFTSRRTNGLYTELYLCHVDSIGHASKAFCLPQRHPVQFMTETPYSFNTPDFAATPLRSSSKELRDRIMKAERIPTELQMQQH